MGGGIRHMAGMVLATLIAVATATAATGAPLPPLREDPHVWNSLFAAAVGDEIRRNCPTISARLFRAIRAMGALESYARDQGYSDAQIEAFLDSDEERALMRRARDAYLDKHGVRSGDAESYCRLGREEIARNTLTGSLLRESK
ncbi:hypothetical protein EV663_11919 [Rhodovulum bhavnagarense]|uniref:DUF5333 domain-containing protein n=1 Tax=Rhodovulum bhavnagarense TaxID=992286 RepID=A0A4R2R9J3_9RHOB|nr:DUF5333 domain-containing protein [Rhodovulum bhavnagarense]TCP58639.1 hypothetical protein EV663_11919 [Rhodovulum bhavnagarense]